MIPDPIAKKISEIDVTITDPRFLSRLFNLSAKERKIAQMRDGDNLRRVCAEEYEDISQRLDATQIQESCSVRNVLRTRRLANLLINDKGEVIVALLPSVIAHLKTYQYSLGPQRQYDSLRNEHILHVLTLLQNNKDLFRKLQSISKPFSHPLAEQIIRDTLQLPGGTIINDAYTRRAVLSSWLCYLRQNVGSCFATAPAIIVQQEQPELFLDDLKELMSTGRLKRTFGGIEYSVPLSFTWGAGDLRKLLVVSIVDEHSKMGIWESPGIIAAFEAAGLVDKEASTEEKIFSARDIIRVIVRESSKGKYAIVTSAEELIRKALMHRLELTQEDLKAFENRPRGMIHAGLLMQVPQASGGMGGKGEAASMFYMQMEIASNAFKSLADNALLKAWEFSLASFSETKSEFTRWNLYSSLGLGPNEPGGIGECLFNILKRKVDYWNQRSQSLHNEYEVLYMQLKQLETTIRHASSDRDAQWIRMDYQSKMNEFHTLQEMRDEAHSKAGQFATLFDRLIEAYDNFFPRYFQEVYDADMHEVDVGPYDDSPAGFRLFYKHGRGNTSQWTRIRTPNEFIDMLANFFVSTERDITSLNDLEGMESDISEIVTGIVSHVRTQEFLETAFHRMAVAHRMPSIKDPLEHLEKIPKKPWAYTSGGTIHTLLSCYYRRESKPTEVSHWVESPIELLVFFSDSIKQIPYKISDEYRKNPNKSMLMHSPTHAFNLKPGHPSFKPSWQTEAFTYTWIRDNMVRPMEQFASGFELDEEKMDFIVMELSELVPHDYRHYFKKTFSHIHGQLSSDSFRDYIVDRMQMERGLMAGGRPVLSQDEIDGTLYALLPLFPRVELKEKVMRIITQLPDIDAERQLLIAEILDEYATIPGNFSLVSAQGLIHICLALLCLVLDKTSTPTDYHLAIVYTAQQLGFIMPAPIIVADTNWSKDWFGFVVNPGSGRFEFWRIDYTGRFGRPMSVWHQWLDGSRKDITWGIFIQPHEYRL